MKILPFVTVIFLMPFNTTNAAPSIKLLEPEVSKLPIHAMESIKSGANIIAIVGGKGLRNSQGQSKNYLVRQREIFFASGLNFYLLPNPSKNKKAGYSFRNSVKNLERIKKLVQTIKNRNSLPIFIIGFSRGAVDAGAYGKKYPKTIAGIVLASGIYNNSSKKAEYYSMENIIGRKIEVPTLIVHHKKDQCHVTNFRDADLFFKMLKAPRKKIMSFSDGDPSGRKCGPLHHHGFEGIESDVAIRISNWILTVRGD